MWLSVASALAFITLRSNQLVIKSNLFSIDFAKV